MAKTKTTKRRRTSSDDATATKRTRADVAPVHPGGVLEDHSVFGQLVGRSGLVLTAGNQPNQLAVDQAVFQRNLRLAIKKHQDFPQVVDEFLEGLQAHVEDPDRFSSSLTATMTAAECEDSCRGGKQDCLMRLLLGVEIIQPKVMIVLLEKLPEFMGDDDDQMFDSDATAQIPRLILNQFRWLDRIVDSKLLCRKMLEMLGITTVDIQRDIISCLPEVIDDTEHNNVATQLKDKLSDRQLMVAVLDALSNLNVRPELMTEIRLAVLRKVPGAELQDLPVVVKFLLQSVSTHDAVEVVRELRDQLDLTPGLSTERGAAGGNAASSSRGSEALILDAIRSGITFQKAIAEAWIKAVENVPNAAEHKDVDVLVLLLLHSTAVTKTRRRAVEGLLRAKVRSGKFTHDLLRKTFTTHAQILREYFQSVLTMAEVLLRSPEPAVELFGCHVYQEAFRAFDMYCRQEVVGSLVTHIGSGVTSEVDSALDVLCQLVRDMPSAMAPFSVFIKGVLDYLDNLTVAQIRKLFSMLGTLAFSGTQDGAHIQDDMHILIRKQLSNTTPKYKRMGVIGAIMVVRSLGARREEGAPSISKDFYDQITGLLGMVRTSCQHMPDEYALFMDELACVMQNRQLDEKVEAWISEDVLTDFQDDYVVDVEADRISQSSTSLPLDLCYNLEDGDELEEGNIAVNLLPLLEAAGEMKGSPARKGRKRLVSPACLAPHFRLLRYCQQAQCGGDLEGIDALLGCPMYLFKEEAVEKVESLSVHEKELMCAALFHTLNWFREVINGFSSQSDPEMRGKVLVRLQNITHVQGLLNTCLAATPGFVPPRAIFDCEVETISVPAAGAARKGRKKAAKGGKKSPVGEKSPDPNDTISTATQDGTQPEKDSTEGDKEEKQTIVNLEHYRAFFRELDLEVFSILKCGMVSKSVLDTEMHTKETTVLELQPTELLFLLKDLNRKLEHVLIATAKRKTFLKTKSERNYGFSHLDQYTAQEVAEQVVQLLPALCDHLESTCTYFQSLLEENDGVVDGPWGDQAQTELMSAVFSQLLQALARLFSWNGFIGSEGQKLLQQAVSTLAGRMKVSSTTQTSTQDTISHTFRYVENFLTTAPTLSTTVCLIRLMVSISDKGSQPEQFNSKIAEHTQTILKREWIGKDGQREKGAKCNEDLQFVLKTFLDYSEDKLSCIEHLATVGIPELVEADKNGCSNTYPTLTRQSLGVFYRAMTSELVVCVKDIPTGKVSDAAKVQVERLFRWSIAVRIFHILINLVKAFDGRVYLGAAQKYGRMFVEVFLRQGMPVLDNVFKTHKDDVHSLLKNLQLSTRAMHHMCGFSKVSKDVALTNYVPLVKKTLEMFVYRVKAMLTMNKCLDAFWLGNLKNRDLQGEEMSSQAYADQTPADRQSDDDTDNDASELPDDDDDSDTTNLEDESVDGNDSVDGESYSESY
ncbi:FANCD2 [Branchiostoma lanceolatum]|uniref:FANCD2 protein n=2 Tax=Branchiostoma lanceolatum TaxID=7740 RepID=A0A8K0A128_BRALA|nr:FANCD2 [Branchiostoma lanceolatum]CAH1266604.1 FANCD2 [Branchiostoma lanceolatum]CAH1266605.1 FANCD2 [Branchiostoma lanceolatum]CAH1266606.1 FANCD2 [Branchiostoma lanceolatum]CAH1266607.1 FANCD2 [Branchiostoma lanceolatum]